MKPLAFTKMHGLGNDFVVIDAIAEPVEVDAAMVRWLADRRHGVGCDQVLVVEPGGDDYDFGYRIYNADGGEVEHCGNGVRCVARLVHERGYTGRTGITFAAGARRIPTRWLEDGQVAVDMGVPDFRPAALPFTADAEADTYELDLGDQSLRIGAVSMGNPHAVVAVDTVADAPVTTLGPRIERHPAFPHGVNAGFVERIDPAHVRLRVWERGAGETRACGTGACAAVAVGRRGSWLAEAVTVELPGGALVIEWSGGDNPLWMTGPATTVFRGEISGEQ